MAIERANRKDVNENYEDTRKLLYDNLIPEVDQFKEIIVFRGGIANERRDNEFTTRLVSPR
jgi:hypothetical protein